MLPESRSKRGQDRRNTREQKRTSRVLQGSSEPSRYVRVKCTMMEDIRWLLSLRPHNFAFYMFHCLEHLGQ